MAKVMDRIGRFFLVGRLGLLGMLIVASLTSSLRAQEESPAEFDERIAPVLVANCLECHRGVDPSGGLDLSTRESIIRGGDSGAALSTAQPNESLIWQRIADGEMPPESELSEHDKKSLLDWIGEGAPWGEHPLDLWSTTTEKRAGYDWWSLQPIVDPPVPEVTAEVTHPIDAFVVKRLEAAGLHLSPPASPRVLVRRLANKMTGMQADIETVKRFESESTSKAFADLADRYLQSDHYGERWARHWLDLARFGESQGFERDKSREHAWRYRDWVIRALNEDMPYDQFARMQIAGDCYQELGSEGVIATGFLVGGPYDEVGQSQQSAAMRAVVRQDEMEDYVGTLCQAFLGLTANCARCHDHKFDPISQSEYYSLCSALDGVRAGDRDITSKALLDEANRIAGELQQKRRELAKLEDAAAQIILQRGDQAGSESLLLRPLAHWDFENGVQDRYGKIHTVTRGDARVEDGALVVDGKKAYAMAGKLPIDVVEKTLSVRVTLDNLSQRGGGVISLVNPDKQHFDAIVFGEREPGRWMPGSDGFRRTQNVGGTEEQQAASELVHIAITYAVDGTITMYRNGEPYGKSYRTKSQLKFKADQALVVFGIRHFPVGGNRMLSGRIHEASLFDRALSDREVARLSAGAGMISEEMIVQALSEQQRTEREALLKRIEELQKMHNEPPQQLVYAVKAKQPESPTQLLLRGNPATPAGEVAPGGIGSLSGIDGDFGLAVDAPEDERRRRLAEWVTSDQNPLFARVIVNRLWQHHFGEGLVATPNDFGFTGGQPSHPQLLDYLAARLIESNWSLKSIHRLIVTSATWQQSSLVEGVAEQPVAVEQDQGNRLLWHANRTRLDAESIRDAILSISGQLNGKVGGPPYKDFETFNFNSQFYDVGDPVGEEFNRRTIYRMIIRSGRHRMLDAFDCPDPSATAPKRPSTTTPLQSLSLMNHAFSLRMAEHFAERVAAEAEATTQRVERAVELAWCRAPSDEELKSYVDFVASHGLAAFCRVLINSNEFLYID